MRRATLALLLALVGCGEEDAAPPAQGAAGSPQAAGSAGASPTAGNGGQSSGGAGVGSGGEAAGGEAAGGSGQAGAGSGGETAGPRLATTLAIDEIALYQAVEVKLAAKGAEVSPRNAPVVAGREAVVRVKVSPGAGFSPQKFRAELVVEAPGGRPRCWPTSARSTATVSSRSSSMRRR